MLTITGKDLESDKKELDGYFATLDRWSKSNKLPSRTRFMVRDVLDLRRSRWVPRREALQVMQTISRMFPRYEIASPKFLESEKSFSPISIQNSTC